MLNEITPNGPLAQKSILLNNEPDRIQIEKGWAEGSSVIADWWNDRLQFLVYDAKTDETALHIRLNEDGSIHEIVVRKDIYSKVYKEGTNKPDWQKDRDGAWTKVDWIGACANGETELGYTQWLKHKIKERNSDQSKKAK